MAIILCCALLIERFIYEKNLELDLTLICLLFVMNICKTHPRTNPWGCDPGGVTMHQLRRVKSGKLLFIVNNNKRFLKDKELIIESKKLN